MTVRGRTRLALSVLIGSLGLAACSTPAPLADDTPEGCIADFDADVDYYPTKTSVEHAENFSLRYEKSYQVLTIDEPFPGGSPVTYALVHCGAPTPSLTGDLADATVVTTPIDSLYAESTTHLPLLAQLDRLDVLSGVANASRVVNADVRKAIDVGDVVEYGSDTTLDVEQVVADAPDVVMSGGTNKPEYAALRKADVTVVANAEWLEASPLGRAEWLKVMAALTGEEAAAEKMFERIESGYHDVKDMVADAATVEVLTGNMWRGTWSVPGGASYQSRLLADAGATHPWADTDDTGSLSLSAEEVAAKASDIPLWLASTEWRTKDDVTSEDPRYAELAAMKSGQVWTIAEDVGPNGGNGYWERGVTRPDLVLADLAAIVHPDRLPGHDFQFYRQVGR
ncbi:ABC transporter substrate-binding protein [Haloechinothrix salitolerans]|uniref:ABC transporter substrate-binding protein n=1 Tax=Haloechinothrix salitolerans TaxID=926830 RepID=A0ABW2C608_9PSEU